MYINLKRVYNERMHDEPKTETEPIPSHRSDDTAVSGVSQF